MRKFMILIPLALASLAAIACGSPSENTGGASPTSGDGPLATAGAQFRDIAVTAEGSVAKMIAAHQVITPDALSRYTTELSDGEQAWSNETAEKNWSLLTPAEQTSERAAFNEGADAAVAFGNLLKQMMPAEMAQATAATTANDTGDDDDDDDTCPAQLRTACNAACAATAAAALEACNNLPAGAAQTACQVAAGVAGAACYALCRSKCPAF